MQVNNSLRVVVDTNIWISFLISDRQSRLDTLIYKNKIIFLFSAALLFEINQTILKPKLRKYFSANALEEMLVNLESFIDIVEVNSIVSLCRDTKDNFLLELSKDGEADFLITGDKDLLDLKTFGNTKIVTITKFLENLKNLK